jgi:hypothetical protein
MPDQPKRSVFDPSPKVLKGDGKMHEADSADYSHPSGDSQDKGSSPGAKQPDHDPAHVNSLVEGLKGLLGISGQSDMVEGGKSVSKAVDDAVASAPGNNADY